MKHRLQIPLFLLILLLSGGCKKNSEADLSPDLNVADDVVIAESAYNHAVENLLRALADPVLNSTCHSVIDSANVVYVPGDNKYIFYFISKMSPDSVIRNGTVEMYRTGNLSDTGTFFRIFFQNLVEYRNLITGYDSVVYRGIDDHGKMVFVNYITEGVIHKMLELITWTSTNSFRVDPVLFQSGNVLNYYINGIAAGTSSKGHDFTAEIGDSLIYADPCPWIGQGTIRLKIPGADISTGFVDFITGDGCTNRIKYDFEGNYFYLWNDNVYLVN